MAYGGPPENPYTPPQTPLGSMPGGVPGFTSYAGFWLRVLESFVDGFVILGLYLVIIVPSAIIGVMVGGGPQPDGSLSPVATAIVGVAYLVFLVAYVMYFALMESSSKQATLGKMALGLKVVDLQGQRISFGRSLGRALSKIFLSGLICGIGYIMAGFTEKKQALHDMIAGTLVVKP